MFPNISIFPSVGHHQRPVSVECMLCVSSCCIMPAYPLYSLSSAAYNLLVIPPLLQPFSLSLFPSTGWTAAKKTMLMSTLLLDWQFHFVFHSDISISPSSCPPLPPRNIAARPFNPQQDFPQEAYSVTHYFLSEWVNKIWSHVGDKWNRFVNMICLRGVWVGGFGRI